MRYGRRQQPVQRNDRELEKKDNMFSTVTITIRVGRIKSGIEPLVGLPIFYNKKPKTIWKFTFFFFTFPLLILLLAYIYGGITHRHLSGALFNSSLRITTSKTSFGSVPLMFHMICIPYCYYLTSDNCCGFHNNI